MAVISQRESNVTQITADGGLSNALCFQTVVSRAKSSQPLESSGEEILQHVPRNVPSSSRKEAATFWAGRHSMRVAGFAARSTLSAVCGMQ